MQTKSNIRTPKRLASIPGQRSFDAQTLSMIVALASEVTVLRARLDTCERLLIGAGILQEGAIDGFSPSPDAQAQREVLRQNAMTKIFRSMIEVSEADLASLDEPAT